MYFSNNAIEYSIRILLGIAIPEWKESIVVHTNIATVNEIEIEFRLIESQDRKKLLSGDYQLNSIQSVVNKYDVPIVLDKDQEFSSLQGGKMVIHADIVTLSFYLLSRVEELLTDDRDKFDRLSYYASLSCKYNLIDIPIVDEYAFLLRDALRNKYPELAIADYPLSGRVIPTHDIDSIRRFYCLKGSIKTLFGDLLRYPLRVFAQSIRSCFRSYFCASKDPEIEAIKNLMNLSKDRRLVSEFYFMGNTQMKSSYSYDVGKDFVKEIMQELLHNGMVVGLHGDLGSSTDLAMLEKQKFAVATSAGIDILTGRQHFLMFDAKKTPVAWEKAGVKRDLSLGFFDREGFMCGTCHEFPLYDIENDKSLGVIEQPLIVMDCTLKGYRQLSKKDALIKMLLLHKRCVNVGGSFVILWHNGSTYREYEDWFNEVYINFLNQPAL